MLENSSSASVCRSEMFDLEGPSGTFRIKVAKPHTPSQDLSLMITGEQASPVYIMDGNELFGITSDLTRMMQFGGHVPPSLIVGIGYPEEDIDTFSRRRRMDLTPSDWQSSRDKDYAQGGGAAATLEFLTECLMPRIEGSYDVDPRNGVLAGLSYGGLFSLFASAMMPDKFPHHIALSPSLFWDDRLVLKELERSLHTKQIRAGRIFVAAGAREMSISPPTEPDLALDIAMVQNVCTVGNLLARHSENVTGVAKIFDDESHHSIIGIGLSRGLRFTIGDAKPK